VGPSGAEMTGMRRRAAAALVVVLGVVTAACSSGGGGSGDGRTAAAPDVLRIGVERPQSLDPAQARSPAELLIAEQVFDGLTTYDAATSDVQPALARAWEASPDQRRWDFTLRGDARFANDRPVTSADVKYTLERIARKGSSSPVAGLLEGVVGFRAFNVEGRAEGLAGITTPAPDVVRIELEQPLSALPALLGYPAFGIVPREAAEAESPPFAVQPTGSGPFMIESRADDVVRLVPSPGSTATVKAVDILLERDVASSYAAFVDGRLDWTAVPADRVEQVAEREGRAGFRPYLGVTFYGFNLKNPKFADVRFREAIVRAVDRDAIVRLVYGAAARPASGLVPEGVPGFQPGACAPKCSFGPDRARQLVREVFGDRPAPEVQIDFDDNPTQQAVARAIQANLREAGIPAGLRPKPFSEYVKFVRAGGEQEMFRLGAIGAYPTPDAFLTPLFQTGQRDNLTGFSSPDADELLKAGRAEGDQARRLAIYQQAEKVILDQLPAMPLVQFEFHSLASARVSGLVVSGLGTFDAAKVRLAG
jgi:oligopeptide transport system substrate-binding protein